MKLAPPSALPPAIILLGPTASGKTQLAMHLVDRLPLEIISVDSAQVFRDMNIGTAKPDAATLARYPHALINLITPEESYSAARFRADALCQMAAITARGRIPLLVGGTMLYFKALLQGLADLPDADRELRAEIDRDAAVRGWPALHADLARLDAQTAARLAPNDAQRIQRALQLLRLTGKTLQQLFAGQTQRPPPYRLLSLALVPQDRSQLHARIAQRFAAMLELGLVPEVERLRLGYRLQASLPAMRCVGYRQVWEMLEGQIEAGQLLERGIYATRQLAKRQLTWMKKMPGIQIHDPLAADSAELALERTRRFLGA